MLLIIAGCLDKMGKNYAKKPDQAEFNLGEFFFIVRLRDPDRSHSTFTRQVRRSHAEGWFHTPDSFNEKHLNVLRQTCVQVNN